MALSLAVLWPQAGAAQVINGESNYEDNFIHDVPKDAPRAAPRNGNGGAAVGSSGVERVARPASPHVDR